MAAAWLQYIDAKYVKALKEGIGHLARHVRNIAIPREITYYPTWFTLPELCCVQRHSLLFFRQ
jgi:hypothetical protein